MRRDTTTKRTGRKPSLTPHTRDTIVRHVTAGQSLAASCALAGIHVATMYRWIERANDTDHAIATGQPYNRDALIYCEFRDALARARAQAAQTMVDVVFRNVEGGQLIAEEPALDGSGNPIKDADGNVIMKRQWSQPDGRLALAYLKVAQPGDWGGGPQRIELTGADGAPLADGDGGDVSSGSVEVLSSRVAGVLARQREERAAIEAAEPGEDVHEAEVVEDGD